VGCPHDLPVLQAEAEGEEAAAPAAEAQRRGGGRGPEVQETSPPRRDAQLAEAGGGLQL